VPEWVLVPCLVSLRGEFNELAPRRSKTSDGSIGDAAHASTSSDHNPDETGATPYEDADSVNEVHAIDVDKDLNRAGWSMDRAVGIIVARHRLGLDNRLQNVIYRGLIYSRSWGWTAREYTGPNPHNEHAHYSARYTSAQESDTRPWGLLEAAAAEEGIVLDQATKDWFISLMQAQTPEGVRKALIKAADGDDPALRDAIVGMFADGVTEQRWRALHALRGDTAYQQAPEQEKKGMRAAADIERILWRAAKLADEAGHEGTAPPPLPAPPPAG